MATEQLFTTALGLQRPWYVKETSFDAVNKRLELFIDFRSCSRFRYPECERPNCSVHDTRTRTWRHLDFFQHQTFLSAPVPRVKCASCGIERVSVPWARENSGLTLYFEILALQLAQTMPIKPLAEPLGLHPNGLWRIIMPYVEAAHDDIQLSNLERIGVDECARQKGHTYFTVFGNLSQSRVVFIADTREAKVIEQFSDFVASKSVDPGQIKGFCSDMGSAYLKGIDEHFPEAQVTFDRYHLMAKMNQALDQVRRQEARQRSEFKGSRYIWSKNQGKLTNKQHARFALLKNLNLKTVRAYQIKVTLQEL